MFRFEAMRARETPSVGDIILARPISFAVLTLAFAVAVLMLISFIIWGAYTKRVTVQGQLVSASGQIKIYSPQYGRVQETFVTEGQYVAKGAKLASISSERFNTQGLPVQAEISASLGQQKGSLLTEYGRLKIQHVEHNKSLTTRKKSLEDEISILAKQYVNQKQLLSIASNASARYESLMGRGYISMDQLQQRQAELLGQRRALQSISREQTSLRQQIAELSNEIVSATAKQTNELESISRLITTVEKDIMESDAKRNLIVTAPEAGVTTAILAQAGQTTDGSRPLLMIIPEGALIEAELYAPSRSVGFVKPGDTVRVRYQSFPFQKFGQYNGHIISVSIASISSSEMAATAGSIPGLKNDGEQYYHIRVGLNDQSVLVNNRQLPLKIGMLLEADILQETRRLYEWVFEPLQGITQKF